MGTFYLVHVLTSQQQISSGRNKENVEIKNFNMLSGIQNVDIVYDINIIKYATLKVEVTTTDFCCVIKISSKFIAKAFHSLVVVNIIDKFPAIQVYTGFPETKNFPSSQINCEQCLVIPRRVFWTIRQRQVHIPKHIAALALLPHCRRFQKQSHKNSKMIHCEWVRLRCRPCTVMRWRCTHKSIPTYLFIIQRIPFSIEMTVLSWIFDESR